MKPHDLFTAHWTLTLLLLCVSALIFATASVNLFMLLQANLTFIYDHGSQALEEGALRQLAELLGSGIVSAVFYLIFKTCEKVLIEKILE